MSKPAGIDPARPHCSRAPPSRSIAPSLQRSRPCSPGPEAESTGASKTLEYPELLRQRRSDPAIDQLLLPRRSFLKRGGAANETQIGTLREQVKQANSQVEIYEGQASSRGRSIPHDQRRAWP